MVDEFEQGVRVAVPEATLQAQYSAIVWMLRRLVMSYIKSTVIRHLKERSSTTNGRFGRQNLFSAIFIEPNRNDLLKEYEGKLVFGGEDASADREDASTDLVYVYANPTNTNSYNQTLAVNYSADTI